MSVKQLINTNYFDVNANTLHLNSTANTTSSSTGALIVGGGAYIGGNILCGGSVNVSSATVSLTTSCGGASGTYSVFLYKNQNLVSIVGELDNFVSGTISSSEPVVFSAIPLAYRPTININSPITTRSDSTYVIGLCTVNTNGAISVSHGASSIVGFSTSHVPGGQIIITYPIS